MQILTLWKIQDEEANLNIQNENADYESNQSVLQGSGNQKKQFIPNDSLEENTDAFKQNSKRTEGKEPISSLAEDIVKRKYKHIGKYEKYRTFCRAK